ncbi:uncharacterized protein AAGF69_006197 [Amazona ochrocephala]
MASLEETDKGNSVKLVLTVNGQLLRRVSSSTPVHPFLVPETTQSPVLPADEKPFGQDLEDPTAVKSQSSEVTARASRPGRKDACPPLRTLAVPCALKPPSGKVEATEAWRKSPVHLKKPRKVLFEPTASERDLDEEDLSVKELQGSPSPRWCHAMCISDLGTAVLIGGEGVDQQPCKDAFWKMEMGGNFRAIKSNGSSRPEDSSCRWEGVLRGLCEGVTCPNMGHQAELTIQAAMRGCGVVCESLPGAKVEVLERAE